MHAANCLLKSHLYLQPRKHQSVVPNIPTYHLLVIALLYDYLEIGTPILGNWY